MKLSDEAKIAAADALYEIARDSLRRFDANNPRMHEGDRTLSKAAEALIVLKVVVDLNRRADELMLDVEFEERAEELLEAFSPTSPESATSPVEVDLIAQRAVLDRIGRRAAQDFEWRHNSRSLTIWVLNDLRSEDLPFFAAALAEGFEVRKSGAPRARGYVGKLMLDAQFFWDLEAINRDLNAGATFVADKAGPA